MTARIVVALVTALVMGMWFNATRPVSIAAAAILVFMYPVLVIPILAGTGVLIWHRYFRE